MYMYISYCSCWTNLEPVYTEPTQRQSADYRSHISIQCDSISKRKLPHILHSKMRSHGNAIYFSSSVQNSNGNFWNRRYILIGKADRRAIAYYFQYNKLQSHILFIYIWSSVSHPFFITIIFIEIKVEMKQVLTDHVMVAPPNKPNFSFGNKIKRKMDNWKLWKLFFFYDKN